MSKGKLLEDGEAEFRAFFRDNFRLLRDFYKSMRHSNKDMQQVLAHIEEASNVYKITANNPDNSTADVEMKRLRIGKGQKRPPIECDSNSFETPSANSKN